MTIVMRCDEKDRLVGYLYEECSAAEQSAVEAHLARCPACAAELEELKDARSHLAGWNAPPTDLGFRLTRDPIAPAVSQRSRTLPLWAQAAAAVLVLAAGAGLANLEIEYRSQGLTLRTGWASARQRADKTPAAPAAPQVATVAQLQELERRVRSVLAASPRGATASRQSATASAAASTSPATVAGSPDVPRQLRAIIAESEERQRKEFAFRLAQVVRDLDNQRSADLVRIEQNLRQLEGVTGEQVQGQHEMMNYLRRVSSPRP
jgi:anti-sigma factor RsiW